MQLSEGGPVSAGLPDLVYVIGPGDDHDEFRYSLRSVAKNVPHRKVWVVGSVPAFTTGIVSLPLTPHPDKYQNIRQSLTAAVNHSDIADEIVFMNDDFFVVQPVAHPMPVIHLGPMSKYLGYLEAHNKTGEWVASMRDTAAWCGGDPLCYESHIPLTFATEALSAILRAFPFDRTFTPTGVYQAARAGLEGVLGTDTKVTNSDPDPGAVYLSTENWSFRDRPVGDLIRSHFSEKCEYEL